MSTKLSRAATDLVNAMYPEGLKPDAANKVMAFAIATLAYAAQTEERSRKVAEIGPESGEYYRGRANIIATDEKENQSLRRKLKQLPPPWNDGRLHRRVSMDRNERGRRAMVWLIEGHIEIEVPVVG